MASKSSCAILRQDKSLFLVGVLTGVGICSINANTVTYISLNLARPVRMIDTGNLEEHFGLYIILLAIPAILYLTRCS